MSVTKEQIHEALYYADKQLPTGDRFLHEKGAWAVETLSQVYKEAIEALRELILGVDQNWKVTDERIRHVDIQVDKTELEEIKAIIDKYPKEAL